jgi:KDO2-lipid IV(A) lauroyltransferase
VKKLRHILEYLIFRFFMGVCYFLPIKYIGYLADVIGGFIATLPIKANERARLNLQRVFSDKDANWIRKTQYRSVVNMMKTFFEFSSVYTLSDNKFNQMIEYKGLDNLKNNQNAFVLTAHLGNWEAICRAMSSYCAKAGSIYRTANNPYVDQYIVNMRARVGVRQIPKGSKGARQIVEFFKTGGVLGLLMDQKMNDGIESIFLGQTAMTAPALPTLAAKLDLPVLPISGIRKKDGTFLITVHDPVKMTGDKVADTQACNDILSKMIYQHPEQWMWVHKRFQD